MRERFEANRSSCSLVVEREEMNDVVQEFLRANDLDAIDLTALAEQS